MAWFKERTTKLFKKTIMSTTKDPITTHIINPFYEFTKKASHFMNICSKPDKKEFLYIATATATGFLIVGFCGFFFRLVALQVGGAPHSL
jgi:protein transport protein SEC61 subunit gamma-like protein